MDGASSPARRGRIRRRRIVLTLITLLAAAFAASQLLPPWLFASHGIGADERVVFFPTPANLSADGTQWEVSIHGWIFEPESGDLARQALVSALQGALGLDEDERSEVLARRVRRFLVDNERGEKLTVTIAGRESTLAPSQQNGHFEARLSLPAAALDDVASSGRARVRAVTHSDDTRDFSGEVHLIQPEGLSVISDIDDTVKLSEVTDKKQLLRNTFLEEFRAVPGMADLYRRWERERGARFHFVSSGPWQLYEELAAFLSSAGFPPATFHLKFIRFKDSSILDLFADPLATKVAVIEPLLQRFARRRFVLVGDSGEKDPEVYGALARRYPEQIHRIFIRNVTGELASSARFTEAFADVPREKWSLFADPSTVELDQVREPGNTRGR